MKRYLTAAMLLVLPLFHGLDAREVLEPSATYLFASRDTCELYLDIYEPSEGSVTSIDGKEKPTVIFIFGGGFKEGERDGSMQKEWFRMMVGNGFRVVATDYRLGFKGAGSPGINPQFTKLMKNAVDIAVEDLFSATSFLIENRSELGIDPSNIVICGSSAGAITALQAEWVICNHGEAASVLPAGFNYKGVMSFAGAIFSTEGAITYREAPCPMLMLHGTADHMVEYGQMWFFKLRFAGTDVLTDICRSKGYNYNTYRFDGNGHEISIALGRCFQEEMRFIEENVMKGTARIIDCTVKDPGLYIPDWAKKDYKSLYR